MANRTNNAAALERGSQEAFSAIVRAMSGKNDVEKEIADNTKEQVSYLRKIDQNIKKTSKLDVKTVEIA